MIKRPSNKVELCGTCHAGIASSYKKSLHFTTIGQREILKARFSPKELSVFDEKVFAKACNSCHASCGDCHVKSPVISGVNLGFLQGHKFVRSDESKTCALCHGGRVYPEFTGEYGGNADVHYQKGMMCLSCHKKDELHGDGHTYLTRKQAEKRPSCSSCHEMEKSSEKSRFAHRQHRDKVSCTACHSAGEYRNCYNCHLGEGSQAKAGFILGRSPRDGKLTTLRVIPTVRDTFKKAGLTMENFDSLPNYWDTATHNIRKRTDRTRACDVCHKEEKNFLKREDLLTGGSKANEKLLYPLKK